MGSTLPAKEGNLFKIIVKSYESKQYKRGLKASDSILKKYPDHGETLAMKGLTLNCLDRKTEAYELVRRGLKNDLKSHVCWHVYGLLYRSDREYREAIKCYRNALRIDPENIQILRDLSLLQAQMRDFAGFVETRRQLLTLKPNHRNNWIGFAIAHHANFDFSMAVQILEAYEGTLDDDYPPDNEQYEHSEMLLYKASLLDEAGATEKALEELSLKQDKIVDKVGLREHRGTLLLSLHRLSEAEEVYRVLLDLNPENYSYYEGLHKCLGLHHGEGKSWSEEQVAALVKLYEYLQTKYLKSAATKRIPLDFLDKSAFQDAAKSYIQVFLAKGVPSIFSDLLPLYEHPGKANILEVVITEIEASLRETGCFPLSSQREPPSTLMWTLYLLAQHFDQRGEYGEALARINEAIIHTPTAIDLYSVKARILKHAGDPVAAAALSDEARSMDLADRYLNSECVKRMLQADQVELAEKTAVLFTKDGDQHNNLFDMQCMWYELASGHSHFRQGLIGRALKNYLAVEKHYNDIVEDQFDFHTYCLRKMTLRAYIRMVRFQENLHSHRFFRRAAACAIRCYLYLYDAPPKLADTERDAAAAGMPSVERKRMRQKIRKAEARAKKQADQKAKEEEAAHRTTRKGPQPTKHVDNDPHGELLVNVDDPLEQAIKYTKLLQDHSPQYLETHLLAFEIYSRKKKILLAFQALKRQLSLNADDPSVHRCLIFFFAMVDSLPAPVTQAEKLVQCVIAVERAALKSLGSKSLSEVNQDFLEAHSDSLLHRAAAAEALVHLFPDKKAAAIKIIEDSPTHNKSGNAFGKASMLWQLKDCLAVHQILQDSLKDSEAADRWRTTVSKLFPYSTHFKGAKSSAFSEKASKDSFASHALVDDSTKDIDSITRGQPDFVG